jgi:hypothetical protein
MKFFEFALVFNDVKFSIRQSSFYQFVVDLLLFLDLLINFLSFSCPFLFEGTAKMLTQSF